MTRERVGLLRKIARAARHVSAAEEKVYEVGAFKMLSKARRELFEARAKLTAYDAAHPKEGS